jgi:hypothetical protein
MCFYQLFYLISSFRNCCCLSWRWLIDWLIDHVDGGETTSLHRGHQQAYFSSPRWYMIMENHGEMMMSAGGNCRIVYQSSLAILPWEPSGSMYEEWTTEVRILPCKNFIRIWKWFFTCRKISRHGSSGFTSPSKEVVLWIFITLKNPSPWLGLNPRPLGPVTSTLTTAPSRQLSIEVKSSVDYTRQRFLTY